MNGALLILLAAIRSAFFLSAAVCTVVCLGDWLVRTRRLSPFGPVARFFRATVDPLIAPVERKVVRAGGLPSSAPWWALAFVVVAGIVVINLLDFLATQVSLLSAASEAGPAGVLRLCVVWTFAFLRLAIIVRVASSWIRIAPYSRWVRWAFAVSEPLIGPLRRILPALGPLDLTPIIAYFALGLIEAFVLRALL
ncbi:MAG: hypothetical protein NVS4B3_08790 [Gemmatimonadaceae bacterium]